MSADLIAGGIGLIVGAMLSVLILGDGGPGIELRHFAIALPLALTAAAINRLLRRP